MRNSLVRKMIKNSLLERIEFITKIQELDTSTYANLMNKTADWPWSKFLSNNDKALSDKAEKSGRINTLSRELFEREFYKMYPPDSVRITVFDSKNINNTKELYFKYLIWGSNWTNYRLIFGQNNEDIKLEISGDYSEPSIPTTEGWKLGFKGEPRIVSGSIVPLKQMFKFRNN